MVAIGKGKEPEKKSPPPSSSSTSIEEYAKGYDASQDDGLDLGKAAEKFFNGSGMKDLEMEGVVNSLSRLYKTFAVEGKSTRLKREIVKLGKITILKGTGDPLKKEHNFSTTFSYKFGASFAASGLIWQYKKQNLNIKKPSVVWPTQLIDEGSGSNYLFFAGEPAWTYIILQDFWLDTGEKIGDFAPSSDYLLAGAYLLEKHAHEAGVLAGKIPKNSYPSGDSIALLVNRCKFLFNSSLNPNDYIDRNLEVKTGGRSGGVGYFHKLHVNYRESISPFSFEELENEEEQDGEGSNTLTAEEKSRLETLKVAIPKMKAKHSQLDTDSKRPNIGESLKKGLLSQMKELENEWAIAENEYTVLMKKIEK